MKKMTLSLRALAALLNYPGPALRENLDAVVAAIDEERALPAARRKEIHALASQLRHMDPLEAESRYVELFDRGRSTALHLFEHVHGDSRERGPAMVDLIQHYEKAGLHLQGNELPDHLCVVLEFASTQPPQQAREFLCELAHILNAIFSGLQQRESSYACLVAAVLELAGQKAAPVPVTAEQPLDQSWQEPQAFDGCSTAGQSRPGQPQPIHFVRRTQAPAQPGAHA